MWVYAGVFLIAFATLVFEVTLTRLLSVITWYHLAFFAVATAMLGMTAGAIRVYLDPRRYCRERIHEEAAPRHQRAPHDGATRLGEARGHLYGLVEALDGDAY